MRAKISALVFALALTVAAQPTRADDIEAVLAMPTQALTFATAWMGDDAGIYKKNGLKVTTRQLAGIAAHNAVINGSADFSLGTAGTFLNGVARGQRLLVLANLIDRPSSELVMRKDVADQLGITAQTPLDQRIKAMKGKIIGLNALGAAPHAWLLILARKVGLDPERDMTVSVVDSNAQAAMLQAKKIDGIVAPPPFTTQAIVKQGAVILASPIHGDLPEYYPTASIVLIAKPETCRTTPEKCLRMTHAMQDAVQLIREKSAEAWEIVKKHNAEMDPAVLEGAWQDTVKTFTTDMRVTDKMFDSAQQFSLDAGLIEAKDRVNDYKGLFSGDYLK